MTSERILALGGLVVALWMLARFGPGAVRTWRIFSGVKTRRMADAGPLEIPPPVPVADRIRDLHELGFARIGERFIRLPGTPIRYEWLLGEPGGEIYVSIIPFLQGALVSCYSSFDDGQWIQTTYPRGQVIHRPLLQTAFVETSVAAAVDYHRSAVARLATAHGLPRRVLTMADSLRMDDDYRRRHGGETLRAPMRRILGPALGAGVLALVCAALLVISR